MIRTIIFTLLATLLFAEAPPDPSPALAGIAHVAFRVSDVQKSRAFYSSLGFEQAFEFADPGKPVVSYIKINDRQFIELYGRADDSQALGLMHVCYEAADIESVASAYAARGLNPPQPLKARAGNLLFSIHDPEGNLLEYTQYLPGSLHFEDRGKHLSDRRISGHLVRVGVAAHDLSAAHSFYISKLFFEEITASPATLLRLPGNSGESIELDVAPAPAKPRIVFEVPNLQRAIDRLRPPAFAIQTLLDAVSITDPDGATIVFAMPDQRSHSKP